MHGRVTVIVIIHHLLDCPKSEPLHAAPWPVFVSMVDVSHCSDGFDLIAFVSHFQCLVKMTITPGHTTTSSYCAGQLVLSVRVCCA